jgi:hypothetical protein
MTDSSVEVCSFCGTEYKRINFLISHVMAKHQGQPGLDKELQYLERRKKEANSLECGRCFVTFKTRKALEAHWESDKCQINVEQLKRMISGIKDYDIILDLADHIEEHRLDWVDKNGGSYWAFMKTEADLVEVKPKKKTEQITMKRAKQISKKTRLRLVTTATTSKPKLRLHFKKKLANNK